VLFAFSDIFLAFSQLTRILRSALTLPRRDHTVLEKFSKWVSSEKW